MVAIGDQYILTGDYDFNFLDSIHFLNPQITVSSRNNVVIGKKKLSNKNETSHQMAQWSIIMLHFALRCKYLIFMNGSLCIQENFKNWGRGEQDFYWLPEIFAGYQLFLNSWNPVSKQKLSNTFFYYYQFKSFENTFIIIKIYIVIQNK